MTVSGFSRGPRLSSSAGIAGRCPWPPPAGCGRGQRSSILAHPQGHGTNCRLSSDKGAGGRRAQDQTRPLPPPLNLPPHTHTWVLGRKNYIRNQLTFKPAARVGPGNAAVPLGPPRTLHLGSSRSSLPSGALAGPLAPSKPPAPSSQEFRAPAPEPRPRFSPVPACRDPRLLVSLLRVIAATGLWREPCTSLTRDAQTLQQLPLPGHRLWSRWNA